VGTVRKYLEKRRGEKGITLGCILRKQTVRMEDGWTLITMSNDMLWY
jgi:hypothetical protein